MVASGYSARALTELLTIDLQSKSRERQRKERKRDTQRRGPETNVNLKNNINKVEKQRKEEKYPRMPPAIHTQMHTYTRTNTAKCLVHLIGDTCSEATEL